MSTNNFAKKQIVLLILCALLATAILVIGLVPLPVEWLKIVLCGLFALLFCWLSYLKFIKYRSQNKNKN